MRYRLWCAALAAALVLPAGAVRARECDGVSFPEHLTVQGQTLTLNGLGIRKATWFRIKVYVGALYLAHPSSDAAAILKASEPSEIVLHFMWSVSASQLREAWKDGFAKSAAAQLPQLRSRIAQFDRWMTGAKSGQSMAFVHVPGQGIEYLLDDAPRGRITGDDFARALLGIWLGQKPPGRALKAGLLGGACE